MASEIWLRCAQQGNLARMKMMKKTLAFLDINCVTRLGQSALMLAIGSKHKEIVNYLFKLNCDLNICDLKGENAISLALRSGDLKLSESLYEKGCRVSDKAELNVHNLQNKLLALINMWKKAKYLVLASLKHKIHLV